MTQPDNKELRDSEIKQAFELLERKRLKQLFNELEKMQLRAEATISPMFIWKKFAVAASVFGLIITSGVTQFNNRFEIELAFEKSLMNINIKNANKVVVNKITTNKESDDDEVKKRSNVSISVKTLDDLSEISEEYSVSYRSVIPLDSINDVYAKYKFTNDNLVLYLNEKSNVVVYQLNSRYYVKIENKYYALMKSKNISSLKRIFDTKIIKNLNDSLKIN